MLATLPFAALFIYFLVLAAKRPQMSIYNLNDDQDAEAMENAIREAGAIIPLMDMMGCFLAFLGLFCTLAVYMAIFIPRRIQLMKSYLESGSSVLGDVFYEGTGHRYSSFSKYAYVMYAHPVHPKTWLVRKRVRCFQHYTRERITILLLPYYPYSGQPKTDLEMDLASSENGRKDTKTVVWCLVAWIVFLLVSPIYLLHQMSQIEDDYDDPQRGRDIYLASVLGIIPLVAFGGNFIRWRLHRHWVINRGVVIQLTGKNDKSVSVIREEGDACNAMNCMTYTVLDDEQPDVNSSAQKSVSVKEEDNACNAMNSMISYSVMDDEPSDKNSPTQKTEVTAYNSVYMA